MEWVEVTGKTVEEAREKALDLLGVADEDAEVEVLAEAKMGLFGRLREEARVRARVLPSVPRPKDDGRRRRSGGRPAKETPAATAPPRGRPAPAPGRDAAARGGGRSARAAAAPDAKMGATMTDTPASDQPERAGTTVEVPVAEQAEVAKQFVDGLLGVLGIEATSSVVLVDEDTAELQVTGADLGLLIGPKGATLLALQDLARTVVQRQTGARSGRLLLDVAGYRHKRKEALERFTQKVASEVAATGTPTALEPMSSADRKIVHDTVNAIEGVTTTSEGEDPRRRVVVRPD